VLEAKLLSTVTSTCSKQHLARPRVHLMLFFIQQTATGTIFHLRANPRPHPNFNTNVNSNHNPNPQTENSQQQIQLSIRMEQKILSAFALHTLALS